jgi:tetratricopeptide (TPR) repeat protein
MLADVQAQGIVAVKPHVAAMEAALKAAPALFAEPVTDGGTTFVLADGQTETFAALAGAAGQGGGDVAAVFNPYPRLALYLGVHYVEVGRHDEAIRVLDAGLELSPIPDDLLGDTVPELLSERGVALGRLKQWDEALASYDKGLGIAQMEDSMRAALHRGRGFVLIELNRLDEAEAEYKTSLELAPGNEIAMGELAYIEKLRAGMAPTAPRISIPNDPSKAGKMGKN